ncbi:MAG: 3-keto-disaccharide hydrolase [Roseibacillus sp.]
MKIILKSMVVLASVSLVLAEPQKEVEEGEWVSLFNGKDLTGWTPKFKGYALGENAKETFRVEDGLLKVSYDNYEEWGELFGHLFYERELSHYKLRVEYRFVGEQVAKGPGWAWRNNGVMIHGQSAESMAKDQDFPDSIEVQLLGGDGKKERPNGNVCSPGTQIFFGGQVDKRHCIKSSSKTFHGDQWVTLEIEAHGSEKIIHRVNGEVVFEYQYPQKNDGTLLEGGSISLQAESAPIEFRKIELLELPKPDKK